MWSKHSHCCFPQCGLKSIQLIPVRNISTYNVIRRIIITEPGSKSVGRLHFCKFNYIFIMKGWCVGGNAASRLTRIKTPHRTVTITVSMYHPDDRVAFFMLFLFGPRYKHAYQIKRWWQCANCLAAHCTLSHLVCWLVFRFLYRPTVIHNCACITHISTYVRL